jgi:hypothetical protein
MLFPIPTTLYRIFHAPGGQPTLEAWPKEQPKKKPTAKKATAKKTTAKTKTSDGHASRKFGF